MLGNDLRPLLATAANPMRGLQLDQTECRRFPYRPSKQEVNSEIRRASKSRELASHADSYQKTGPADFLHRQRVPAARPCGWYGLHDVGSRGPERSSFNCSKVVNTDRDMNITLRLIKTRLLAQSSVAAEHLYGSGGIPHGLHDSPSKQSKGTPSTGNVDPA